MEVLSPQDARLKGREAGAPKEEEVGRQVSSIMPGQGPVEEALMGSPDPGPQEGGRCECPGMVSARTGVKDGSSHLPSKWGKPHSCPHPVLFSMP